MMDIPSDWMRTDDARALVQVALAEVAAIHREMQARIDARVAAGESEQTAIADEQAKALARMALIDAAVRAAIDTYSTLRH
jgi:hypothetical protein